MFVYTYKHVCPIMLLMLTKVRLDGYRYQSKGFVAVNKHIRGLVIGCFVALEWEMDWKEKKYNFLGDLL